MKKFLYMESKNSKNWWCMCHFWRAHIHCYFHCLWWYTTISWCQC